MKAKNNTPTKPKMSDAAVQARTGKTWKEWFSLLDKTGAKKMSHQEIVKFLHTNQNVGPWWQQMVTVTYEQARGLRDLHQKPGGYEISVSRTLNFPVGKLYQAFANQKERATWLPEDGVVIRKATPNKTMRVGWNDGKTSLSVYFATKDAKKTQVVVQHSKLSDAKAAAKMKTYWAKALDRLDEHLAR